MTDENKDMMYHVVELHMGRPLSTSEKNHVDMWVQQGHEAEVIAYAIEKSYMKTGGRNIIAYANAMLGVFGQENLKTTEEVKAFEEKKHEEWLAQKRKSYSRKPAYAKMEVLQRDPHFIKYDLVELKSCPFCGSTEIGIKNQYSTNHKAFYTLVECAVCGANTRTSLNCTQADPQTDEFWKSDSVNEVVKLWNARVDR